jgi:hypothetical protein
MTATPQFDPFHNRQCRDIRNALSESFIAAVHQKSLAPVSDHVEVFKSKTVAPFMARYMDDRLKRYQAVIQTMLSRRIPLTDVYRIACQMWNQSLFFEFHEWLEESWHLAQGDEKRMLQTLIRSAGAYLLHTAGRANGAQKLASKAVAGLKELRSRIPDGFDVERLIKKLADLDSPPPRFGC